MVGRLSRRYHAMSRVEISGILLSLTLLRRSAAFVGIFDVTESLAICGIISCSCDVPNPLPPLEAASILYSVPKMKCSFRSIRLGANATKTRQPINDRKLTDNGASAEEPTMRSVPKFETIVTLRIRPRRDSSLCRNRRPGTILTGAKLHQLDAGE